MSEADTERTVVKTYVPAYQRDEWDAHAEELEMSRAEFVRSMVQAGRRGFGGTDPGGETGETGSNGDDGAGGQEDGPDLEATVVEMLSEGPRDWDELLDALTADIEDRLEATLQDLQDEDRVRYSGRDGGYVLE